MTKFLLLPAKKAQCKLFVNMPIPFLNECQFQIQVCKIVPRQCYQKKLEGNQVSTQGRKSTSIQPE
jgi:hypothetical protein